MWILIGVFSLSALFFAVAFFKKDPYKQLDRQLEQQSIQMMQEVYLLKKKIEQLEARLDGPDVSRDELLTLQEKGHSPESISHKTGVSVKDIERILAG
ncbi:hypothetical protein ACFO4L_16210 [Bacillus daqingensis]|uniref:Uncharacterized protein n=1 Tax=Bacillus daqingensis TaxID=872396 RepID=A0ABV9P2N0_9BACI